MQHQVDVRAEAFQIELAEDSDAPKSQPVWIGVGCEPSKEDVPDYSRPAGPVGAPRSHRGLVNYLIVGGQVEPFPPAHALDQRLLYRGQPP